MWVFISRLWETRNIRRDSTGNFCNASDCITLKSHRCFFLVENMSFNKPTCNNETCHSRSCYKPLWLLSGYHWYNKSVTHKHYSVIKLKFCRDFALFFFFFPLKDHLLKENMTCRNIFTEVKANSDFAEILNNTLKYEKHNKHNSFNRRTNSILYSFL